MLTADVIEGLASTVGSLALLGSVGFGVYSGTKSDWEFEYKPGNDEAMQKYGSNADLALIEVSPDEVAEDMVKVRLCYMYLFVLVVCFVSLSCLSLSMNIY